MALKNKKLYLLALMAGGLGLVVYLRALSCDFINFDDPQYVYDNPAIKTFDFQFVAEALTTSYMGWWMPLTWISLAADHALWGLDPFGFHLTNILLHAANTCMVAIIASRLIPPVTAGRGSDNLYLCLVAALLWGLHPLRVESVVWVTERKDVLNGFFALGSILFYLSYVKTQERFSRRAVLCYGASLVCFAISLMAKPASVLFPLLYLILDWYPLKRVQNVGGLRLITEKIPFLVVSVIVAVATFLTAAGEAILIPLRDYPLWSRFVTAGYALAEYVRLTIWPAGLTHLYPIQPQLPVVYYMHTLIALCITAFAVCCFRRMPWVFAAWASFVLLLLPVLGLLQNGSQSHADRFTYIPAIIPTIFIVGVLSDVLVGREKGDHRGIHRLFPGLLIALAFLYGALTVHQIGYWQNSGTLWSHLLEVNPMGRAYYYRGDYFTTKGDFNAAAADFGIAAEMARAAGNPETFNLHALRGDALNRCGRFSEAVGEFTFAITLHPSPNYFYHRGIALRSLGRAAEAERDFVRAGGDNGPIQWTRLQ